MKTPGTISFSLKNARLPMKYLASLFSGGNVEGVETVMKKLMAVRYFKRGQDVKDVADGLIARLLREAGLTPEAAEEIYSLTSLPTMYQRYVMPPLQREEAISSQCDPQQCKGCTGLGFNQTPARGA